MDTRYSPSHSTNATAQISRDSGVDAPPYHYAPHTGALSLVEGLEWRQQ
jgi:hypothetical protein